MGPWVCGGVTDPRTHGPIIQVVDRSDNDKGDFVMSLAEGEMIHARRKDRPSEPPTYFVVCKLDRAGNPRGRAVG